MGVHIITSIRLELSKTSRRILTKSSLEITRKRCACIRGNDVAGYFWVLQGASWVPPGCSLGASWVLLGCFLVLLGASGVPPECFVSMLLGTSGYFWAPPGCLLGASGCFFMLLGASGMLPGYLRGASYVFEANVHSKSRSKSH